MIIQGTAKVAGVCDLLIFNGNPTVPSPVAYAGIAATGCLLVDIANAILYINMGSQANPYWVSVGSQMDMTVGQPMEDG